MDLPKVQVCRTCIIAVFSSPNDVSDGYIKYNLVHHLFGTTFRRIPDYLCNSGTLDLQHFDDLTPEARLKFLALMTFHERTGHMGSQLARYDTTDEARYSRVDFIELVVLPVSLFP